MANFPTETIYTGLLKEMSLDYLDFAFIVSDFKQEFHLQNDEMLKQLVLDFIETAMKKHGARMVQYDSRVEKFIDFELSPEKARRYIDREWQDLDKRLYAGDIAWFTIEK